MNFRMNSAEVNPVAFEAMMSLEVACKNSGLDPTLYELIKLRASQINGCSFCIDMHGKDLQGKGESFERILLLTAWRETSIYTDKEKAVLELVEAVTRIYEAGVPDEVYQRVMDHFSEKEYVDIIMAINVINSWNRLAISTGMSPGCFI